MDINIPKQQSTSKEIEMQTKTKEWEDNVTLEGCFDGRYGYGLADAVDVIVHSNKFTVEEKAQAIHSLSDEFGVERDPEEGQELIDLYLKQKQEHDETQERLKANS